MLPPLALFCTLLLGINAPVESIFKQVAPAPVLGKWSRTPGQTTAVVLIHGFHYHFRDASVPKAEFRPWQQADSPLVKELAKMSDVYVFGYGQNATLDTIVKESNLGGNIVLLRGWATPKLSWSAIARGD